MRFCCEQPFELCAAFHEVGAAPPPCLLWWPTIAPPVSALVQLPHGASPVCRVPSACEPVRMSCWLPGTGVPFSVSDVSPPRLLASELRSATDLATTTPFVFIHGPLPMRSRALTAGWPAAAAALKYARHVRLPAPAAAASVWHCLSAPASPPRFAPLPGPALVMKKLI